MAALGRVCLLLALAVCVYGAVASIYGVRSGRVELAESGRRSMYALAGILTVAFVVLELALLRNAFSFNTVADTASRTTPALYRAAAICSSHEGSLLAPPRPQARGGLATGGTALRVGRVAAAEHRDAGRGTVVMCRARRGRLLAPGRGRERLAEAVADGHGAPALPDDPGAAPHAEGVERGAR